MIGSAEMELFMSALSTAPPNGMVLSRGLRRLSGRKPALKLKEVWAIRIRLQLAERMRDLAMFNLAVDSKLRACDLTGRPRQVEGGRHPEEDRPTRAVRDHRADPRHGRSMDPARSAASRRLPLSQSDVCRPAGYNPALLSIGVGLGRLHWARSVEPRNAFAAPYEGRADISAEHGPIPRNRDGGRPRHFPRNSTSEPLKPSIITEPAGARDPGHRPAVATERTRSRGNARRAQRSKWRGSRSPINSANLRASGARLRLKSGANSSFSAIRVIP